MTPSSPSTEPGTTAPGNADTAPTNPLPEPDPPPGGKPLPPPDITVLNDEAARRLLAPAMDNPTRVWAYASAATAPGSAPVDEVLLTEMSQSEMNVVWVRHTGSYSGAAGHLLGGPHHHQVTLLRCWESWVFELADLVEAHGDRTPPHEWPARFAYTQTDFLRWTAAYGMNMHMSNLAHDNISETIRDHPDGGLTHDLGDLSPDGAAQIAALATRGPSTLIPPGWDLHGWDHTRTRTHPLLTRLRPDPHNPLGDSEPGHRADRHPHHPPP